MRQLVRQLVTVVARKLVAQEACWERWMATWSLAKRSAHSANALRFVCNGHETSRRQK